MKPRNPFGDDAPAGPGRVNPFGDDDDPAADPLIRLEHAARAIRGLRNQLGAEGLTLSAMRSLLDETAAGLDAAARALRAAGGAAPDEPEKTP